MSDIHAPNKQGIHAKLKALCAANDSERESIAASLYADDAMVNAYHPVNDLSGRDAIVDGLWQPLFTALPDVERRDEILLAGEFQGKEIVSAMGHFQGTFSAPLFDIPPTHGNVHVRYGEVHLVRGGRIAHSWVLVDMLDLMWQAGCWPVAPSLGAEGMWAGPATCDGVQPGVVDAEHGATSLKRVKDMHGALLSFDGTNLDSMPLAEHWTKNFLWYGPSGIGTTRGLEGFRAHHQIPFLRAFPDRTVGEHIVNVGDGDYVVTGGWPSVVATHIGNDWLALPPTGKHVGMRVMDFYRLEDGVIAENWVPIDIIDVLRQLGVDVFDRMRHRNGTPRMSL